MGQLMHYPEMLSLPSSASFQGQTSPHSPPRQAVGVSGAQNIRLDQGGLDHSDILQIALTESITPVRRGIWIFAAWLGSKESQLPRVSCASL